MSTADYTDVAEALTGLMSMAMADDDNCRGPSPAFRLAVVDGELSLTNREDNTPGTLSFRGRKCVAEAFNSTAESSLKELILDMPLSTGSASDYTNKSGVIAWLDSVGEDPSPPSKMRLEYEDLDATSADDEDGPDVEDFFYTTQCPDINHLRSLSLVNRWTETEFVVWDDARDVAKLSAAELDFYRFLFVFLSAADDLVNFNLGNLQSLFRQKDIQHYYVEQESIEAVHSRVYSTIQLMLFGNNSVARADYVRKCISHPAIVSKIRWLDSKVAECTSIAEKYIMMMIIEGVFFSSSFAAIAYLRTNNLFTVTCQLNTLISRDEAVHTTASCLIYNNYLTQYAKPSPRRIHNLFKDAVAIECEFLRLKAPTDSHLLNLPAIYSFVHYSADRILSLIGMPPIFDEPKPASDFPMALMFTADNTNFFERRNTSYAGCLTNDL